MPSTDALMFLGLLVAFYVGLFALRWRAERREEAREAESEVHYLKIPILPTSREGDRLADELLSRAKPGKHRAAP